MGFLLYNNTDPHGSACEDFFNLQSRECTWLQSNLVLLKIKGKNLSIVFNKLYFTKIFFLQQTKLENSTSPSYEYYIYILNMNTHF